MMDKLISQQAAIEAVENITSSMSVCVNSDECRGMKRMQKQAIAEIENLPSAEPDPSQVARDIATILENEKDMRVIATQPNIIRCKDCAYCDSDVVDSPYGMTNKVWWCDRLYEGANENLMVEPDGYCSFAERREMAE